MGSAGFFMRSVWARALVHTGLPRLQRGPEVQGLAMAQDEHFVEGEQIEVEAPLGWYRGTYVCQSLSMDDTTHIRKLPSE